MKDKIKKHNIVILLLVTLAILIGVVGSINKGQAAQPDFITINDTPVPIEEYKMFLQDQKALTVNYFVQTYGAEYGADFWTTSYGEEIPLEVAKEKALQALVKAKVEQQIAKDLGIIKTTEFESILKAMQKEKSIYGAENLDTFQQYTVYHSKLMLEALQKYKINEKELSEEVLKEKYDTVKDTMFDRPDQIETVILEIKSVESGSDTTYLNSIIKEITQGIEVDQLIQKYEQVCTIKPQIKNYGMTEGKDENMSELEQILKEEAYRLEAGELSLPIGYGEEAYLIVCMARESKGIAEFEEVKLVVEDLIKEEQFEAIVEEQIVQTKIKREEKLYDAMRME